MKSLSSAHTTYVEWVKSKCTCCRKWAYSDIL